MQTEPFGYGSHVRVGGEVLWKRGWATLRDWIGNGQCGDTQGLQKAGLADRMIKLVVIQACRFPVSTAAVQEWELS